MTFLLVITVAMLVVCTVMLRVADKQIADRDQRINALHVEVRSADEQCEEWRATATRLRGDLARQVDLRIRMDDALEEAHQRVLEATREAVALRREAHVEKARADRAEKTLRQIAAVVSVPTGHPDVGEKILERLAANPAGPRQLA